MTKQATLESLALELLRHKVLYYEGSPEISDHDYDLLESKIRALDPHHKVLSIVGFETKASSKNKQKHRKAMLSLAKTYSFSELISWQKKRDLIATPKIDGNSLSLIYKKGKLSLAKTRGNGTEGEDVTQKILWVDSCPKKLSSETLDSLKKLSLDENHEIEIRGELYCEESKFLELSKKMTSLGLPQATNPRNIVAGVLSRKNHIHLARYFSFFSFDVIFDNSLSFFEKETKKIAWLKNAGLSFPPSSLLKKEDEIKLYLDTVKEEMHKQNYAVDGAVFIFDDLDLHKTLGETAHHPRYKMSFKWQGETATSIIKKINWNTSRFGTVTPVAHIEAVDLSGAKITHVTLHNMAHVKLFRLKKGDKIEIVRSGEVIPKFLRVLEQKEGTPSIPSSCPSCASPLKEENIKLVCENKLCEARKLHRILNWIRHADIDDLSEKRLMSLMEQNKVKIISDLYRLTKQDFLELPLTKEKMAEKLFKSIQKSKSLPLVNFLCALGIEGAGKTTWLNLIKLFPSLDALFKVKREEIIDVDGFAEKTADQIVEGLAHSKTLTQELKDLGLNIENPKKEEGPLVLEGMTFVLTGTLSRPREEITSLLNSLGAKASSSVTKKTKALVSSDFTKKSTKSEKAKKLSVPLWSEEDLLGFIQKQKEKK